jgi:O-antigen ligase
VAAGVLALAALLFGWQLLRQGRRAAAGMALPAWALTCVLFLAYWLPELLSLPDALVPAQAVRKVLSDLLALPVLWLAAMAAANAEWRRCVFSGLGGIALVWTLDAWIAAMTGTSPLFWLLDQTQQAVLGAPLCRAQEVIAPGRLGGVFGPCHPRLGIVLASLSPFALALARQRWGRPGWGLVALAMGGVILLAGARAAWLTFALVLLWSGRQALGRGGLWRLMLAAVLALVVLVPASPTLQQRLERTALVRHGDFEGMDAALSGRLRIWSAALCLWRTHWINGVGVRSFRAGYAICDGQGQRPPVWGEGAPLHAHQLVLEVASETGTLGLLLWLAGAALAWRAWRYADPAARERAAPAALALLVSVFPLNTHLAAYSTFWGSVLWLLAGLYAGSLWGARDATPSAVA